MAESDSNQQVVSYLPPGPVAEAFHDDDSFIRGILGPVGSGKSSTCVAEILQHAMKQHPQLDPATGRRVRRSRWGVIRNTYPELKSTTIKTWQAWVPDHVAPIKWDAPITSTMKLKDIGDGTGIELEVMFLALDKPEETGKLRSAEFTGIWINEASEIPREIFEMATQRVGRYPEKKRGGPVHPCVVMDTNPPDDDHWWYQMAEMPKTEQTQQLETELKKLGALGEKQELMKFFRQPAGMLEVIDRVDGVERIKYVPNPAAENIENLPGGFAYYLRQMAGKAKNWIDVFIMAKYGTTLAGKPVYSEWKDTVHVAKQKLEPIKGLPLFLGWDFGLTPACIIGQLSPRGQLLILDEFVSENMSIRQFADEVVKPALTTKYPGFQIVGWGDPAGVAKASSDATTCYGELMQAGLDAEPTETNDFVPRRDAVAYFLTRLSAGEPAFLLSPHCTVLRKGFNGRYRYARMKISGERYKERPEKDDFSHPHDALQYLCLGLRQGYRRVAAQEVQNVSASAWT